MRTYVCLWNCGIPQTCEETWDHPETDVPSPSLSPSSSSSPPLRLLLLLQRLALSLSALAPAHDDDDLLRPLLLLPWHAPQLELCVPYRLYPSLQALVLALHPSPVGPLVPLQLVLRGQQQGRLSEGPFHSHPEQAVIILNQRKKTRERPNLLQRNSPEQHQRGHPDSDTSTIHLHPSPIP